MQGNTIFLRNSFHISIRLLFCEKIEDLFELHFGSLLLRLFDLSLLRQFPGLVVLLKAQTVIKCLTFRVSQTTLRQTQTALTFVLRDLVKLCSSINKIFMFWPKKKVISSSWIAFYLRLAAESDYPQHLLESTNINFYRIRSRSVLWPFPKKSFSIAGFFSSPLFRLSKLS